MSTADSLSHLIARLHESGASYEAIVRDLTADGFSVHQVQRAYILATHPPGLRRYALYALAVLRQGLFPIVVIGIALFSVASILATAEESPKIYPLYVAEHTDSASRELSYGSHPSFADTRYFMSVKRDLIRQKASFISANLDTMRIEVFKEGLLALEVPIATKGRPGSWWETPAGIYSIEYKHEKHRSGISGVYQPWSLRFQGNFYIHGWPYHADGERVSSTYSGGCIRLQDEDAQRVYELTEVGMPVIVFEKEAEHEQKVFARKLPPLDAEGYLAVDLASGFVFAEYNRDVRMSLGPLTHIVTALVAAEYINLDATITVPKHALIESPKPRLKAGTKVRVYDLLFPLLRESSNESAMVLASVLGEKRFVEVMNKKAASLGMHATVFVDPAGISDENISTPADLYQLMLYIESNRSFIVRIASGDIRSSAYGTSAFDDATEEVVETSTPQHGLRVQRADGRVNEFFMLPQLIGGEERLVFMTALGSQNTMHATEALQQFIEASYD